MPPTAQPGLREPARFSRLGWQGFGLMLAVVAALGAARSDLAGAELHAMFGNGLHVDWLLMGLGIFFLFCSVFDVSPRLDLATLAAGFAGGTMIEIWGTRTGLWHYYTFEKPPLWILPAWSMSALSNERILRVVLSRMPAAWRERVISEEHPSPFVSGVYRAITIPLLFFFLWWARPAGFDPYNFMVAGLLFSAFWSPRFALYSLCLLACGASLGVFLEIWGTTRHCWNYYDGKTPSPFPIFGHGMAGVSFWKMKEGVRAVAARNRGKVIKT
jgi:hypothetical protein